ncbi:hypothetical protein TNCV_4321551 [Trichonephila clavipes]|uniref:Uncharacterized protein n=1 Tax=Trichonephila clavipes TaxID=2585209 RepID=A0A8X6SAD7_TRICX|nr:hypothetical protein TNCV_4321551 [Trichonephila clavipes]
MVLKANDRRTSCPCHDEFRGPRSDYVRQRLSEKPTSLRATTRCCKLPPQSKNPRKEHDIPTAPNMRADDYRGKS